VSLSAPSVPNTVGDFLGVEQVIAPLLLVHRAGKTSAAAVKPA